MSRKIAARRGGQVVALFFGTFLFRAGIASAATYSWIGPPVPGTGWSTSVFWGPTGTAIPGNGDTANITPTDGAARTVTYDYVGSAVTLNSLTIDLMGASVPYPVGPTAALSMSANNLSATAEYIGNSGIPLGSANSGRFAQSGGTNTVGAGGLSLGFNPNDIGWYDLSGGTLTVNGSVYTGGSSGGSGGVGVLNVSGTAVMNVSGTLIAYNNANPFIGLPTSLNLSGGTIKTAALNLNGTPALLNWTGGTLNITNSTTFDSAAAGTSTSATFGSAKTLGSGQTLKITGDETLGGTGAFGLTVNSGGTNNVIGDLYVNSLGSLTVNSGGSATQNNLLVGNSSAVTAHVVASGTSAVIQAANSIHVGNGALGDMSVSGGASVSAANAFQVGPYAGGIGTLTVSGTNSLAQGSWYVWAGWYGQGTITVDSGGTVSTPGDVSLAVEPGSQGTVNINNGGTITAASAYVGGNWANPVGGLGVMNVNTGGTLNVSGALEIVKNMSLNNTVNLAGGTINVGSLNFHGTPSLLNWTSGTLNINNSVIFDSAAAGTTTSAAFGSALALGSGQTLKITGDESLGNAGAFGLTINSGGTNNVTGTLYVNTLGGLTVNSGGSVLTAGLMVGPASGSNSAISINSGGTVNASSFVSIGNDSGSMGQITVTGASASLQSLGTLYVGGGGNGTLNVNTAGGVTASSLVLVGNSSGSTGQVNLSGSGSNITATGQQVVVGASGNGSIAISNGANVASKLFGVGVSSGGVGHATIDGVGSQVVASGASGNILLVVGQHGQGTLTMTNNAFASAPVTEIGEYPGAVGNVTLSSGSTIQTAKYLSVGAGYNPDSVPPVDIGPVGGTGTLTINSASSAAAGLQLRLGNGGTVDVSSGGTVNVGTGTAPSAGTMRVGTGGSMLDYGNIVGDVLVDGGSMDIDTHSDAVGAVTLASGSITGTSGVLTGTSYGVQSGSISAKLGGAAIAMTKSTSGTVTLTGNNSYGGGTTVNTGTLIVGHVNALGAGALAINNTATSKLQAGLSAPVQLPSLTIAGGATPTAKLDVTDNNMVVHNGDISTTIAQLKSGLNASGTLWTGTGIQSSTAAADAAANSNSTVFAVGAIKNIDKNNNLIYSTWPASPSPDTGATGLVTTDVLVKYTYSGDADLNGVVDNTTDYDLWSNGFTDAGLAATNGWLYGDFDFSGVVDNTTDYDLWSTGFAHQGGALAEPVAPGTGSSRSQTPATSVQAVPEPGALVLAILGFTCFRVRRRQNESKERQHCCLRGRTLVIPHTVG